MAIYAVQPGRATVVKIPDPAQTQSMGDLDSSLVYLP